MLEGARVAAEIAASGRRFAFRILALVPPSQERSAALRRLVEAIAEFCRLARR